MLHFLFPDFIRSVSNPVRTQPTACRWVGTMVLAFLFCVATVDGVDVADPIPERIVPGDIRVDLLPVADRLESPIWLTHAGDGSDRLFVADQAGRVFILADGHLSRVPFLDVSEHLVALNDGFDERGLLGLAFHPGFDNPADPGFRRLYTYTSQPVDPARHNDFPVDMGSDENQDDDDANAKPGRRPDHQSVLTEWQADPANPDRVNPMSRREILRFDQPQFNHDGGCLLFGPDRLLYISVGDGGAANDRAPGHGPTGNGQNLQTVLGTILRLDPLGLRGRKASSGRYSVPEDNPFVDREGIDEIWAYGLRNPWRMAFDRDTGILVAADVGQNQIEEINIIQSGGNYGWRIKEGTFFFDATRNKRLSTEPPSADLPEMIDPVAQYDHDEGTSITGGFVYRGSAFPELKGKYVFADWNYVASSPGADGKVKMEPLNGRLMAADLTSGHIEELTVGSGKTTRYIREFITGFGEDPRGELYVLTNDKTSPQGSNGKIYKLVPLPKQ